MHQCRLENKAQTGESRRMDHPARQDAPRQRILKAARELFDAKGFHATTTAELATEAAVSIGQIYRLFDNKDDVIIALVEENTKTRIAELHGIFARSEKHTSELQSIMSNAKSDVGKKNNKN